MTDTSLTTYLCDDGDAAVEIQASSPEAAAQEYVGDGDYTADGSTIWIKVWVYPEGDEDARDSYKVRVDPPTPACSGQEHAWCSPHEILGGLRENPGVQGHGGGVVIREVCSHCGIYRITDTWAQDRTDGQQGLDSVEYEDADDTSLEWIERKDAV
jgi:hypothetical protein